MSSPTPRSESPETSSRPQDELGRERPKSFPNPASEIGFCFSLMLSQIMAEYFISGFNVLLPSLAAGLDIPASSSSWPASAFSLTAGSSLLIFGRLADKYGGFIVFVGGLAWHLIWSIVCGFAQNEFMLIFCRALQGFGPAAFLSAGVMLLGSTYAPGPRKNMVFSIYGGCAPLGFFLGIFFSGLTAQFMTWRWYFFLGAILLGCALITALMCVPPSIRAIKPNPNGSLDILGSTLLFTGLILTFYAVNDCGHAEDGWRAPYIYTTFIAGSLILFGAFYVEGWVAKEPLLPASLFRVKEMKPFLLALFFSYGVLGVWLLYTVLYMQEYMGVEPLQVVAWYVPFALGGIIISLVCGSILHLVPGTVLLVIAGTGWVLASLLFAIVPLGATYWSYIFPAMICGTLGIDITYNISTIFMTTHLPEHQQGLAAAVVNSTLFLGVSFLLGWADFTASSVPGTREGYKAAFWFAVASAAIALLIMLLFVKIKPAKGEKRGAEETMFQERQSTGSEE